MSCKQKNRKNFLIEIFDTLFIMILCFSTLLVTMIMKGGEVGKVEYSINSTTLIMVMFGFAAYLMFILPKSDYGLRIMIRQIYGDSE